MAHTAPRPWMAVAFASLFGLIISACSLMPELAGEGGVQRAEKLVRDGQHAESARAFAQLAATPSAQQDYYRLRAAEQWVEAGDLASAEALLRSVSAEARTKQATLYALVNAEFAVAKNDGARAIRELDAIQVPDSPEGAARYFLDKGRAAFSASRAADAVRAYVERERWLSSATQLRSSRDELYSNLRAAAERGASLKNPGRADGIVSGWLELAPVAIELARNPMGAGTSLAAWRKRFPLHPANDGVLPAAASAIVDFGAANLQIALLLPLSGRGESSGIAVRDGFLAAYLEQAPAARPKLQIYDVAAEAPVAAFQRAVAEGATFIVGPLTKEDVAAVAPLSEGRTPMLGLNFLGDDSSARRGIYQFALLPEDDARAVARRVTADGHLEGLTILPATEWGRRIGAAFADELSKQGGRVLDTRSYEPNRTDFSDIIRGLFQIKDAGKPAKGEKPLPPTFRTDASFVFMAGSANTGRLLVPQLNFHYVGATPTYSTADSFEPDAVANADVDGLIFPDMPWMISIDPVTSHLRDQVRAAWPARVLRRGRLYAFGFDAYRLVGALRGKALEHGEVISGMTGRLHLDTNGRIRRDLDWAQIKGGVPRLLPSAVRIGQK
jgi:uncharacterized protein